LKQQNTKPTVDVSKLLDEEIKKLIEKNNPIWEQMEEAIEKERGTNM
jgi:hypothetical protein